MYRLIVVKHENNSDISAFHIQKSIKLFIKFVFILIFELQSNIRGINMFQLGNRKITKQGGSYIISLPMQWVKNIGTDIKTVKIEMDTEYTLRIVAGDFRQDNADCNCCSKPTGSR